MTTALTIKSLVKQVVPRGAYQPIVDYCRRPAPVRWGGLRRVEPVSRVFGLDRGRPIDRYYIERFMDEQRGDIRGRVMEIGDATYTTHFGGDVTQSDVLHATAGNADATLVGDLETGEGVPANVFDCIILTQTLPFIYDVRAAVRCCHRALAPGGVVLATVPGISQISRYDMDRWGDYWRFTPLSAGRLFADEFGAAHVRVRSHGNALSATAFVQGVADHELTPAELDHHDADYPVTITIRAVKPFNSLSLEGEGGGEGEVAAEHRADVLGASCVGHPPSREGARRDVQGASCVGHSPSREGAGRDVQSASCAGHPPLTPPSREGDWNGSDQEVAE